MLEISRWLCFHLTEASGRATIVQIRRICDELRDSDIWIVNSGETEKKWIIVWWHKLLVFFIVHRLNGGKRKFDTCANRTMTRVSIRTHLSTPSNQWQKEQKYTDQYVSTHLNDQTCARTRVDNEHFEGFFLRCQNINVNPIWTFIWIIESSEGHRSQEYFSVAAEEEMTSVLIEVKKTTARLTCGNNVTRSSITGWNIIVGDALIISSCCSRKISNQ